MKDVRDVYTAAELREDLKSEQARAARLEQQLQRAQAEIAALRTARDAALKVAAWVGRDAPRALPDMSTRTAARWTLHNRCYTSRTS